MRNADCVVVIPTWNEAGRLSTSSFIEYAAEPDACDLLFVDDGSNDTTPQRLAELAAGAPGKISVLTQPRNLGKGEAVRSGLLHAAEMGYSFAGFIDADLSAPIESVKLLRTALDEDPELRLALGSRVKLLGWDISRSERRHYLGRIFATFASLALALPVYDTQCGAKLIRLEPGVRGILEVPFESRWLFDIELIARLRDKYGASGLREVPLLAWHERGASSLRFRDFLLAPWQLLRIRMKYPPHSR